MSDFTKDELPMLTEGARMLLGYYQDVAWSDPGEDWTNEIAEAKALVAKLEGMQK